jgi:hypothetical protein
MVDDQGAMFEMVRCLNYQNSNTYARTVFPAPAVVAQLTRSTTIQRDSHVFRSTIKLIQVNISNPGIADVQEANLLFLVASC